MEEFDGDLGATTYESEPVSVHSLTGEGGRAVVGVCSIELPEGECHIGVGIDEPVTARTAELRVGEVAPHSDTKWGQIAIDSTTKEQLDVADGDVVRVTGDRQTPCQVTESYAADTGLDVLRCNTVQRENANTSLGEVVTVSPAITVDAETVELSTAGRLRDGEDRQDTLAATLSDRPVRVGDLLELPAELFVTGTAQGQRIPDNRVPDDSVIAEVESISPGVAAGEVAKLTEETDVRVTPDEDDTGSTAGSEPVDQSEQSDSDDAEKTETAEAEDPDTAATDESDKSEHEDTATNDESDRATAIRRPTDRVPESVDPPLPDSVSYDELSLGETIGEGGFAEIRAAEIESAPDTEIAVKRLSDGGTLTKGKIDRFVTEAELWAQCDQHPNVVSVIDWGKVPRPWIAIERLTGGDLRDRLRETGDGLPVDEGVWIATVLAETLADVHHLGVRHLDLQARNVLFAPTPDDAWMVPKIGDWGVAKAQRSGDAEPAALNPAYAAPEQFESDRQLDHRTDVYQLGAVVYELVTGQVPTATGASGESVAERSLPTPPSELRPELPSSVDEVVQSALAPAPDDRYSRAIYVADALDALVEE